MDSGLLPGVMAFAFLGGAVVIVCSTPGLSRHSPSAPTPRRHRSRDREIYRADEDMHRHAAENLDQADALLFGRVTTYEMMEAAWRSPARTAARPEWMEPWMEHFARTIDAAKKYVVSSTLDRVDWNSVLVPGDLGKTVQQLKQASGKGLFVGGVKLPMALAELGLIDEYEFVVQPRLVGHRPTLFAGLSKHVDLKLVGRLEFGSVGGGAAVSAQKVAFHANRMQIPKHTGGQAIPG
jgi:dihydrofolate reductase